MPVTKVPTTSVTTHTTATSATDSHRPAITTPSTATTGMPAGTSHASPIAPIAASSVNMVAAVAAATTAATAPAISVSSPATPAISQEQMDARYEVVKQRLLSATPRALEGAAQQSEDFFTQFGPIAPRRDLYLGQPGDRDIVSVGQQIAAFYEELAGMERNLREERMAPAGELSEQEVDTDPDEQGEHPGLQQAEKLLKDPKVWQFAANVTAYQQELESCLTRYQDAHRQAEKIISGFGSNGCQRAVQLANHEDLTPVFFGFHQAVAEEMDKAGFAQEASYYRAAMGTVKCSVDFWRSAMKMHIAQQCQLLCSGDTLVARPYRSTADRQAIVQQALPPDVLVDIVWEYEMLSDNTNIPQAGVIDSPVRIAQQYLPRTAPAALPPVVDGNVAKLLIASQANHRAATAT